MELPSSSCPICLEGISADSSVAQPCNHTFCHECIIKWTDHNPTCPLCLKEIVTISKKLKPEEDSKEEHYEHKVSPKGSKSQQEEEFECFGHDYFLNEFKALLKRVKDTEFNLKSQMGLKKKTITLEKNYQLALHLRQEVDMKINFLSKTQKITPKDLLTDIQHFFDLLMKLNSSEEVAHYDDFGYTEDMHYDDDCYYGEEVDPDQYSMYSAAMTKGVKSKKKSKGKAKKKDSIEQQKTDVVIG